MREVRVKACVSLILTKQTIASIGLGFFPYASEAAQVDMPDEEPVAVDPLIDGVVTTAMEYNHR